MPLARTSGHNSKGLRSMHSLPLYHVRDKEVHAMIFLHLARRMPASSPETLYGMRWSAIQRLLIPMAVPPTH